MNSIQTILLKGGYQESDIRLSSLLTRRANQTYYDLINQVKRCTDCEFAKKCQGKAVIGSGPINSPLMIVGGQAQVEDETSGVPFTGIEGQLLTLILAKAGIDRNAIYMTYAVKHTPVLDHSIGQKEIDECQKHLLNEIDTVSPSVILTIGEIGLNAFTTKHKLQEMRGKIHEVEKPTQSSMSKKIKLIHTFDPGVLLTEEKEAIKRYKALIWHDIKLAVDTVRSLHPHYTYDRVGLHELIGGK